MDTNFSSFLDPAGAELIQAPKPEGDAADSANDTIQTLELGTDLDASLRFAETVHESLRFCPGVGWLFWEGRRWAVDAEGRALELSKKCARQWTNQCMRGSKEREKMVKLALNLEGASHIKAAVELAKTDVRLTLLSSELDKDIWVLNLLNGTLDLRTGKLRAHRREDFITKLAPINYIPEAQHEVVSHYMAMLEAHSPGMTGFLARCVGSALTGDASAESLFLVQGDGGSGKTTLIEGIATLLGDYAVKLPFESFCTSKHGRSPGAASPDLVPLRGARLAYASEGDQSARLDAGMVKMLTGNEPVTARALYSEPITFAQTWNLFLVTNFDPKTDSDDTGIWRRMIKLPFSVIPAERRDPRIKQTLNNDPVAQSALLAWAVAGCIDWQAKGGGRNGLAPPEAVTMATAEYRVRQDTMAEWWEDLLVESALISTEFTSGAELRSNYEKWCDESGASPVFNQRFNRYLESKNLVSGRHTVGNGDGAKKMVRGWFGLRFGPPKPPAQSDLPY